MAVREQIAQHQYSGVPQRASLPPEYRQPPVPTQLGAGFTPKHEVILTLQKITLLDSRHNIYQFAVTAHGSVIFHPSTNLITPLDFPETVSMSEPSALPQPSIVLPSDSTASGVSSGAACTPHHPLPPQDKKELYAVLQDIANELRRMKHERQKHQTRSE